MSGFDGAIKNVAVPVSSSLTLDAGACDAREESVTVLPPSVAMFDQLLDWLSRQSAPEKAPLSSETIGIGATALCLRWGSYLAVLLDEGKPLDPRIASLEISMVADSEMKRINIEFSSNLARLVPMLHDDEAGCYLLLHLAYQYLPTPRLRFHQCSGDSKIKLPVNFGTSDPRSSSAADKYGLCQLQPAVCRDSPLGTATVGILTQPCVVVTGILACFWHTTISGSIALR
jgi:hypothetical protein